MPHIWRIRRRPVRGRADRPRSRRRDRRRSAAGSRRAPQHRPPAPAVAHRAPLRPAPVPAPQGVERLLVQALDFEHLTAESDSDRVLHRRSVQQRVEFAHHRHRGGHLIDRGDPSGDERVAAPCESLRSAADPSFAGPRAGRASQRPHAVTPGSPQATGAALSRFPSCPSLETGSAVSRAGAPPRRNTRATSAIPVRRPGTVAEDQHRLGGNQNPRWFELTFGMHGSTA